MWDQPPPSYDDALRMPPPSSSSRSSPPPRHVSSSPTQCHPSTTACSTGRRFTYDVDADHWDQTSVRLRVATEPFAKGGQRYAFRARELCAGGDEVECVVKELMPDLNQDMAFEEAMTQMTAEAYAQEFNRACASRGLAHRVAFLPVSVVQLDGSPNPLCLEPFLAGDYCKHSDNDGWSDHDELSAAFSYYTYHQTGGLLVICDIQGVGDFYTDPQIHTFDGEGFGAGDDELEK